VDSHCHLQDPAFDPDRGAVLERARAAGIERILVPGYDLVSSREAVALAVRHGGLVHAAVGIHPHHAAAATDSDWQELEALAAEPAVVAVGEIGLDFFRNLSPPHVQRAALERQLELAATVGKPVLVHDRDAHAELTETLLAWRGPQRAARGVMHAFSGDAAMAARLVAAGFLVSFALPLAFRSATGPRAAAEQLPDESFLVETDAPWLAPGGAGERNEPTTALRVAAELARLRGTSPEEISAGVRGAYDRLVGG
jgi:TatD DNase family protein